MKFNFFVQNKLSHLFWGGGRRDNVRSVFLDKQTQEARRSY